MMMRRTVVSGIAMMLAAASLTLSAYAQQSSTAFTYQGFLKDNNNPANAKYDLQFTLYDAPTGGNQIGNPVVIDDLEITNGLFTVEIDFGINPFSSGQRRWIEIGIRPFNSTRPFVTLDPRIELTPVPYAIYAQKAKDAENAQNAVNAQNAQNAQNAVNAQNAQNAQNAVNAQDAQNAQNAVNAQNAQTAAVANSVAPDSVTSAGLANDPDSLRKVSGRNLQILPGGYLKKEQEVCFRASGLPQYARDGIADCSNWRFLALSFQNILENRGGGGYSSGEYTIPVSGYYFVQVAVNSFVVRDPITNSLSSLYLQCLRNGQWVTLALIVPEDAGIYSVNNQTYEVNRRWLRLTHSDVFYFQANEKVRVAVLGIDLPLMGCVDTPFYRIYSSDYTENQYFTIYLLSAQ
jgi:hypothetical protein